MNFRIDQYEYGNRDNPAPFDKCVEEIKRYIDYAGNATITVSTYMPFKNVPTWFLNRVIEMRTMFPDRIIAIETTDVAPNIRPPDERIYIRIMSNQNNIPKRNDVVKFKQRFYDWFNGSDGYARLDRIDRNANIVTEVVYDTLAEKLPIDAMEIIKELQENGWHVRAEEIGKSFKIIIQ